VASDATNGPLIAVLVKATSTVLAKEGSLIGGWTTEYTGASQVAVASDDTNGPLITVLATTGGQALAKQGSLNGPWTSQLSSVTQITDAG
jgi:hypothetical protein